VSTTSCMAVGFSFNGHLTFALRATLTESWNGSTWTIVPSPNNGIGDNQLNSVSCVSPTSCIAVGYWTNNDNNGSSRPLIESWDGSTWTKVTNPLPTSNNSQLTGVSCVSATSCQAVGWYFDGVRQTLIESWNGSTWTIVASPNVGIKSNQLTGVSCVSATSCQAVGYRYNGGVARTLVESWNGTTWTAVASPNTGTHNNYLNAVSCASATSCQAVGSYSNGSVSRTLIESWSGGPWTVAASPNTGAKNNFLYAVSCASATSCQAVGSYINGSISRTLIESWTGGPWTAVASPNIGTNNSNQLLGVSCVSATSCTAVGSYTNGSVSRTLIESWNGSTWTTVASPSEGSYNNYLNGVSCVSATSCKAVGYWYNSSGVQRTLILSWNGGNWTVASPNKGTGDNQLNGVSCVSATSCKAVGSYRTVSGGVLHTLIESWNGSTWTVVASPNNGNVDDNGTELNGVSCVSSTACKAVGDWQSSGGRRTLTESWNGSTWTIVASPNAGNYSNSFAGVSCVSATSCKAVGSDAVSSSSASRTLIASWNGATWSLVASPNPPNTVGSGSRLAGVSCVSPTSCTAVGYAEKHWDLPEGSGNDDQTLIESWNGSTWSIVASPNVNVFRNRLNGVSCVSATSCTAVGLYSDSFQHSSMRPLIESWDGSSWTVTTSPLIDNEALFGVSCGSPTSCKAVGNTSSGQSSQTFIESYG
jgi:hypothetical protein